MLQQENRHFLHSLLIALMFHPVLHITPEQQSLYNHPDFLIPAIQNHIQCSCGKVHHKSILQYHYKIRFHFLRKLPEFQTNLMLSTLHC